MAVLGGTRLYIATTLLLSDPKLDRCMHTDSVVGSWHCDTFMRRFDCDEAQEDIGYRQQNEYTWLADRLTCISSATSREGHLSSQIEAK